MNATNVNKIYASPNFAFLAKHDEILVRHAAYAERYVFEDPNSALIKLRQLSELLARHAAANTGINLEPDDSQCVVIERLRDQRVITPEVSQIFHQLRKSGNQAAHEHTGDRREALYLLQLSRKLAVWFHRAFGHDKNFKPGAFVPPPDPAKAEQELRDELNRLRSDLVAVQEQASDVQHAAQLAERKREEAEQAAAKAYADLTAALDLAQESERQLTAERQQFQVRLDALLAQVEATSAQKQQEVAASALAAAKTIDLNEQETRRLIDDQLRDAGWEADSEKLRFSKGILPVKGRNMAIAEWPTENGPADYVLFLGQMPVAAVEAKRKTKNVPSSIEQAKRYSRGYKAGAGQESPGGPWSDFRLPFHFATNGRPFLRQLADASGVWFLDGRRPTNHSRALEAWYTPEGLKQLLAQDIDASEQNLRIESTDYLPLRLYQKEAIAAIENALANGDRELLLAMATGTGKTNTALCLIYRLVKAKRFRRVLFLVDRTALAEQAQDRFSEVRLENYQAFTDIYDVKSLGDLQPDTDTKLHFATIQGMVKRILFPSDASPPIPVDCYDCIIVDECHRGYILDRQMSDAELRFRNEEDYISKFCRVLDHFDAVKIGLTATQALHTTQIFGMPIYEYSYRQAVIDHYLVDHLPPYRLVTALGEDGMRWQRSDPLKLYNTKTAQIELSQAPDDIQINVDEFNRSVITENFNRVVCGALADEIDPDLPGKTLIFCVNDLHADLVVRLLKAAFADRYGSVSDDAVMKITGAADKPSQLIRRYKNETLPKVAVTVDLLTTGIDVEEIVNLVFIRKVRSRILFDQMLGRATRLCPNLYGEGQDKEVFRIFDAVDIYATLLPLTAMRPVVTNPNITFVDLARELSDIDDPDLLRQAKEKLLAKLRRKRFTDEQEQELEAKGGTDLDSLVDHLVPLTPKDIGEWFAAHPGVSALLDQQSILGTTVIISEHEDELRRVDRGYGSASKPEDYIESFRTFIKDNADKIPALIVVTQRPRDLTRGQLRELELLLAQNDFSASYLREAWRRATNHDIAASIVGYIRHVALGQPLLSHKDRVAAALKTILASRDWTDPQRKWLERIAKQLELETVVDREALDTGQFKEAGGYQRINKVFKGELDQILHRIADAMWQTAA